MLFERGRDIGGAGRQIDRLDPPSLHVLNALFDLTNRFQVFVDLGPVARAQRGVEAAHFLHHRIENAAIPFQPRKPLSRAAAIAEEAFENQARMRLGRIRRGGIVPRDGVVIEAIAGVTRALRGRIEVHFHRRHLRRLPNHPGGNLVGGSCQLPLRSSGTAPSAS